MLAQELLSILCCPESKQKLRLATADELALIANRAAEGKLVTRAGKAPESPVTEALVREDGTLAYEVRQGIPIMLVDEAIVL
jgi:uncharacterized protein